MEERYIPPYDTTEEMLDLVSQIMENLGRLSGVNALEKIPRLRRVNRIKTIQASLAIENNSLSVAQVTDVLDGKRVSGEKDDITAVKNASAAYHILSEINPYDIDDLLKVHGIIMKDLVVGAGSLRTGQVGVFNEKGAVMHIAPPAEFVRGQLESLFLWLRESKTNMLIKSCVFHYEFEFIHPFADGNGRMGRFWQTALLASWKPIFAWIPIESIIKENQAMYYESIRLSTSQAKSDCFITFMLKAINKAVNDMAGDAQNHIYHMNDCIKRLMKVIKEYPQSAVELMKKLKLKSRAGFYGNYLAPALEMGLVKMTEPDKPTSRNQKYYKA